MDDSKVVITYTNPRCHTVVYDADTNTTAITPVAGDSDTMLEPGEKFKIVIDFTAVDKSAVDPAQGDMNNVYTHPTRS